MIDPNARTLRPEIAADLAILRGAPARLIHKILGGQKLNAEQVRALDTLRIAYSAGECSVLHGRVGCGKSTVGAFIVQQHSLRRLTGHMYTVAGLMAAQKSWFDLKSYDKPESPITTATRCRMLVIDELVADAGSLFDHTQLTEIIKARYDAKRPTLILTNIRPDRLADVLSVPVADRIRDGGAVVELKGGSLRGQTC